ncbi:hypothetical protein [Bacillus toyonensis]|uniref:hypothetical protein n=1 Tax=Bacillus toyonensis TaxID=155322 RepID=UPI0035E151D7
MPPRPRRKKKPKPTICCGGFYQLRAAFIQARNNGFSQIEITLNGITTPTKIPAGQILPIQLGQATGETVWVDNLDWFDEQNCRILLEAASDQLNVADRFIDCQTLNLTFGGVTEGPGRL